MLDRRRWELVFVVTMFAAGPVMACATLFFIRSKAMPGVVLAVLAILLWAFAGLAMRFARRA